MLTITAIVDATLILDDDKADVKVAAYSPKSNTFLAGVNELGPLCLDEGKNITYGIMLRASSSEAVIIEQLLSFPEQIRL